MTGDTFLVTKLLKIGLLGTGFVQETFHMPCYREIGVGNVVAVAGRTKDKTESFARRWGIKKVYHGDNSFAQLCEDPEVEVVDIGLPNSLHMDAAICAAENHKHIICEKPLGRNPTEAKKMLEAAERYGVIHCYAENQVFMPPITRVKEFIDRQAVGKVFWIRSREAHFGPHSPWFWDPKLAGGGVLMDMGCHSVEVARYLMDKKPIEAYGWGATLVHNTEAEDNSLILVRYEGGALGQSENSWAAHGGLDLRFEIYGSEGVIFVDATRETGIKIFTVASEEAVDYVVEKAEAKRGWMFPIWREYEVYGYLAELQYFLSSIAEGNRPRESFNEGCIVNLILEAGYESMRTKTWKTIQLA